MATVIEKTYDIEHAIDEMMYFYLHIDYFQHRDVAEKDMRYWFRVLIDKGRVIMHFDENDRLQGYVESWRLNYAQLGYILCGNQFNIVKHDINSGNILYVANTAILPEARDTDVYRLLRNRLFKENIDCDYFCGQALRKRHQPFKCFKKTEFMERYLKEI